MKYNIWRQTKKDLKGHCTSQYLEPPTHGKCICVGFLGNPTRLVKNQIVLLFGIKLTDILADEIMISIWHATVAVTQ